MVDLVNLKWTLYWKKHNILFDLGVRRGLINKYDDSFIKALREFYCDGLPLSIILLNLSYCDGKCFDCSFMATLGMGEDEFRIIEASIDSLRLQPRYADKAKKDKAFIKHCFVERTLSDGTVWVYDTSSGLVIARDLYYRLEKPQIRRVLSKEEIINSSAYLNLKNGELEDNKYLTCYYLPYFEGDIVKASFYQRELADEIALFKKLINYENLCKEIEIEKLKKEEEDRKYRESMKKILELIRSR
ncbi:MAG: hypothetical protein NC483_05540 [Ruminococcus sp.]|nr:hypothetical protein [Ruminococcus sp.]